MLDLELARMNGQSVPFFAFFSGEFHAVRHYV